MMYLPTLYFVYTSAIFIAELTFFLDQSQLKRGLPVQIFHFVRICDGPDYPARVAGRHTIVGNKYYFLDTLPIIGQSTPSAYAT